MCPEGCYRWLLLPSFPLCARGPLNWKKGARGPSCKPFGPSKWLMWPCLVWPLRCGEGAPGKFFPPPLCLVWPQVPQAKALQVGPPSLPFGVYNFNPAGKAAQGARAPPPGDQRPQSQSPTQRTSTAQSKSRHPKATAREMPHQKPKRKSQSPQQPPPQSHRTLVVRALCLA